MQYNLQVFETQDHTEFRIVDIDGEPWFVLGDVCRQLDLKPNNGSYWKHAERLDEDERRVLTRSAVSAMTSTLKGEVSAQAGGNLILINDSGLYSLTMSSKKPDAKRFRKWVTGEVLPSIRKTGEYGRRGHIPAFVRRFNENWDRVASGHFSVISELAIRLYGRLEMVGYTMADRAPDGRELRPENSVGRLFADWLRKNHPTISASFGYYMHWTPQCEFEARQYEISTLPLYIKFVDTVWIPEHSERYFRTRDPAALEYLPKLLPSAAKAIRRRAA